jgi:hypothetical protein
MCKHRKVFSLLLLTDERLTIGILHFNRTQDQFDDDYSKDATFTNPTWVTSLLPPV